MHTRCPTRGLPSAARLTKHRTPTSCVPLRGFAASREANRLQPGPAASISRQSNRRGQNSGWKARATSIRVHSCPFVVQNHPPIRVHSWFKNGPPFVSIRGSKRPTRRGRFVVRCTRNQQVPDHQGGSNRSYRTEAAGPTRNAESIKREAL